MKTASTVFKLAYRVLIVRVFTIFAAATTLLIACTEKPNHEAGNEPFFPYTGVVLQRQVGMGGRLVLENGCLRLASGGHPLLIWTHAFSLHVEHNAIRFDNYLPRLKDVIQVSDQCGHLLAEEGDLVQVSGGGGEISDGDYIPPGIVEGALPASCKGPYWIVTELTKLSPE